mgnify:CR=1 FL=1
MILSYPGKGERLLTCQPAKAPLPKIQPACRPIDSHNERVSTRASARIQPMKNNVASAEASIIGSPIPSNAWAIELKPEVHVTISDVRSGAFRKWTTAKIAETAKIAILPAGPE